MPQFLLKEHDFITFNSLHLGLLPTVQVSPPQNFQILNFRRWNIHRQHADHGYSRQRSMIGYEQLRFWEISDRN